MELLLTPLIIEASSSKLVQWLVWFFLLRSERKQLKMALKFTPNRNHTETDETTRGNAGLALRALACSSSASELLIEVRDRYLKWNNRTLNVCEQSWVSKSPGNWLKKKWFLSKWIVNYWAPVNSCNFKIMLARDQKNMWCQSVRVFLFISDSQLSPWQCERWRQRKEMSYHIIKWPGGKKIKTC